MIKLRDLLENTITELEFDSKEEMDAYKKAHDVRPGTKLTIAPLTKRVGNAVSKGAAKVGDKIMNTVGKALYTTKVGNATMKGIGKVSNKVASKLGLDAMSDKESDAEVDAQKDYYNKKENTIKLKDLLEAYNPAEAFNKKVSKMTDRNEHSAAAVELAIYMDDRDAVRKLQQIKKDHDKRGSLSSEDSKERSSLVDKLLKKAKKELSEKDYKLINSSF
jgi:hypothetical protein